MAEELYFYLSADAGENVAVDMKACTWNINYGSFTFSPAVLRILGDLFPNTVDSKANTLPTFIIYFGKYVESVTFDVNFEDDTSWHTFRNFASEVAYFESGTTNKLQFYWGASGDPFYSGANDCGDAGGILSGNYQGMFGKINVTRTWPKPNWEGTITFLIGYVPQA